jgi:Domain of unknown function (DUF4396)
MISAWLGHNFDACVLAVGLAFAVGYAFTIISMLKTMPLRQAARVALVGDTASISAMEI